MRTTLPAYQEWIVFLIRIGRIYDWFFWKQSFKYTILCVHTKIFRHMQNSFLREYGHRFFNGIKNFMMDQLLVLKELVLLIELLPFQFLKMGISWWLNKSNLQEMGSFLYLDEPLIQKMIHRLREQKENFSKRHDLFLMNGYLGWNLQAQWIHLLSWIILLPAIVGKWLFQIQILGKKLELLKYPSMNFSFSRVTRDFNIIGISYRNSMKHDSLMRDMMLSESNFMGSKWVTGIIEMSRI